MQREWKATPRAAWQNLLVAKVSDRPTPEVLQERLDQANREFGSPRMGILHHPRIVSMLQEMASARSGSAVSAGLTHGRLVLAAHHRYVDGLGLLALLTRLTGHPVSASVEPLTTTPVEPAEEAAGHGRPARIAPAHFRDDLFSDVFASIRFPRPVRLPHLLVAVSRAARRYNARRESSVDHMQITLCGFTVDGVTPELGTSSVLVHLPHAEVAASGAFARAMRSRPRQQPDEITTARRHTSTMLACDLGSVEAPSQIRDIEFYPTAGAAMGVSLGVSTQHDRTMITVRAPASRYTAEDLRELLELLRNRLT